MNIMRKIDSIIIHCSATKVGQDFTAADIGRWHRERGFKGITMLSVWTEDWREGGIFLWRGLIAKAGMSIVSGYAILVGWM